LPALQKVLSLELSDTLFVFISDFYFSVEDKFLTLMRSLASGKNNVVIAAVLANKKEWAWPRQKFSGRLLDSEDNGKFLPVSFNNLQLIKDQEQSFNQWQKGLVKKLRQCHCRTALIDINKEKKMLFPLIRLLLNY
jgi:hypothetical protein